MSVLTHEEFRALRRLYALFWRGALGGALGWSDEQIHAYVARLNFDLVVHGKPGFWVVDQFIPVGARETLDAERRHRLYNDMIWAIDPSDCMHDCRLPMLEEDVAALKARVRTVLAAYGIPPEF